ncbi:hypothetical protein [Polycladomyces subterraneus]|uniref:Uncharacterized protein n=1 Tax=Polycladomyces subterraneus TaxID=1016997 RepID=A0ABT8ISR8_9BACL|nr:hypothetical protein [Polycladomyces subterraneus]MDN4595079.1 hypothetical protein [Polycladomyces subterraneus]
MENGGFIVFLEYRVHTHKRELYLQLLDYLRSETARAGAIIRHEWMESVDQPGLFVEMIRVPDEETSQRVISLRKNLVLNGRMRNMVDKVNIWTFRLAEPSSTGKKDV